MRSPVSFCSMPPDISVRALLNHQKGSGARKDCCLFPTSISHFFNTLIFPLLYWKTWQHAWVEWKYKLFNCQKQEGNFSDIKKTLTTNADALRGGFNRIHSCPEGEWSHQRVIRLSEALSVSGTLWLEFGPSWIRVLVEEFTTGSKKNNHAQTSQKITFWRWC